MLGDLDLLEAQRRASPCRAGSSRRRSLAPCRGAARRPRGAALRSCRRGGRAAVRRSPAAAGSRGRARGRRGRAPGRSTRPRSPCRRPRSPFSRRSLLGRQALQEDRVRVAASACSSAGVGGSVWMWRSLIRTTPGRQRDVEAGACAVGRPRTPSSRRRCRSRRSARRVGRRARRLIAPRNVSCASSSPLRTRASRPSSSRTRSAKAAPLAASRTAEVRTARFASQPCVVDRVHVAARASSRRARSPPRRASHRVESTPCAEARHRRASHELDDPPAAGRRRRSAGASSWSRCRRRRRARGGMLEVLATRADRGSG